MQGHGFGPWRGKFYMLHGVGPHPLKKPQPLVTTWMDHKSESESHSVMSDSLRTHEPYSPWNSPGQNTGACSLTLLQRIFPTQGLNPGLPHCRWILYQLSHWGGPRILEWVAYPFPVDLPDPGLESGSPVLQTASLPTELSGELRGISQTEKDKYCMPLHVESKKQNK